MGFLVSCEFNEGNEGYNKRICCSVMLQVIVFVHEMRVI